MNIKSVLQHGLVNAVLFAIFFVLFYGGSEQSQLLARIDRLEHKIDLISNAGVETVGMMDEPAMPGSDVSGQSQLLVMSSRDVQSAIDKAFETHVNNAAQNIQQAGNQENPLSADQQYGYEKLSQQVDAYETVSFHEIVNDMEKNKLPEKYRNELLSKLASKLNNNEITPEQVLGVNQ